MFAGSYLRRARCQSVFLFGLTFIIAVVSCQRVPLTEEKIIGIWEFTGLDATGRIVFRRDHTVVDLFPENDRPKARWAATSWGKWRLEGNEIVADQEMLVGDYSPSDRQMARIPIRDFEEDRLVRADERPDFNRVKWGAEQNSQILALLYVIASLIGLFACIYAVRNSYLRKSFLWLAIAAGFALAWASLLLVTELTQTGTVILAWASLRYLQWARIALAIPAAMILVVGLLRLMFAIRIRKSD